MPPRVEYSLTEMGKTLQGPINALWDWSAEHHASIVDAREIYDQRLHAVEAEEPRKIAYARGQ